MCPQTKAARKSAAAQEFGPNPLLTPLVPEGATHNPAYGGAEVAAEQPPLQGTYYAPRGSEYVSIAYLPLQSEGRA